MITSASTAMALGVVGTAAYKPMKAMGQNPKGSRQQRILSSPQYRDGSFQNELPTPMMVEGTSMWDTGKKWLKGGPDRQPSAPVPIAIPVYTDPQEPQLTWFGHSSYCLRWPGHNVVVDPVFHRASPISWAGPSPYPGMAHFGPEHLPAVIDTLVITHDHYDHLDYATMMAILPRVKQVVCSLGVGQHFEYWGWDPAKITELDWWESHKLSSDVTITATPARHFSGRGLTRNQTLWSSFYVSMPGKRLFIGGDSGYGPHFQTIKQKMGAPDLAIMECGQYNESWRNIHAMPDETAIAANDLGASLFVPVHWGKFTLALHPWLEPPTITTQKAKELNLPVAFPNPGQPWNMSALTEQAAAENPKYWWTALQSPGNKG